jgi:hypothetical protein
LKPEESGLITLVALDQKAFQIRGGGVSPRLDYNAAGLTASETLKNFFGTLFNSNHKEKHQAGGNSPSQCH